MKHKGRPLNGWLVLDKSLGMSSTQALGKTRWLLNAAKAGHGGTLDPLATGILPLAFGEATKTVPYVMDATKIYRFTIKWGEQRSTDDGEGEVIATSDVRPSCEAIFAALPRFIGALQQKPPAYSALKVDGQRAYDLARSGEEVDLALRSVRVDAFTLIEGNDTFEVTCGKGTYIRSLARDLALALGTVGHVSALRRLRVGRFSLENAVTLDELAELFDPTEKLLPIELALDGLPSLEITPEEAKTLRLGQRVLLLPNRVTVPNQPLVAFSEGRAVAMAEVIDGELRTVRGFNQ